MLEEKILSDYKEAMKNKEALRSSTLSFLRSALNYYQIEKQKKSLDDNDVIAVIKKQIKQHQDSIEQFQKGERLDLVEKETKELEILKSYLPKELTEQELNKVIDEVIKETAATGMKDMGKVMKEVMAKVAGQADGKLLSDLVKKRLSPPPPQQ
jgi:uncharacterized protein YqeY